MIKHLAPREFNYSKKGIALVSYDGDWPNLCSGQLIVAINEKVYTFPRNALRSGGNVSFDENWSESVDQGEWGVSDWPEDYPEDLKEDTEEMINTEIPHGCCGGCV